jgi:NitT/TauT family transport system substrate-binding protein
MLNLKWFIFAMAIVITFSNSITPVGAETIRVGYVADLNKTPFFVALDKGFFEEAGLKIEAKEFISARDSLTSFKGGAQDIMVTMGTNSIAKYNSQGMSVYMIRVWSLPDFRILTLKSAPYQNLKDLKGKAYAVTSFAGTTFALSAMAFNAMGLDIQKDVEIKTFPPAVMQIELERGGVAAGILWQPLLNKALEAGKLRVLLNPAKVYSDKFGKRFFHTGVACTKEFFDVHPAAVKKYLEAVQQGIDYTLSNPEEADKIAAIHWKGYDAALIGKIRAEWGNGWISNGLNQEQIDEMQFMYDKMFELTDYFKTKPVAADIMRMP